MELLLKSILVSVAIVALLVTFWGYNDSEKKALGRTLFVVVIVFAIWAIFWSTGLEESLVNLPILILKDTAKKSPILVQYIQIACLITIIMFFKYILLFLKEIQAAFKESLKGYKINNTKRREEIAKAKERRMRDDEEKNKRIKNEQSNAVKKVSLCIKAMERQSNLINSKEDDVQKYREIDDSAHQLIVEDYWSNVPVRQKKIIRDQLELVIKTIKKKIKQLKIDDEKYIDMAYNTIEKIKLARNIFK